MKISYIENVRLPTAWVHGYQIMRTCEALALAGESVELVIPTRRPTGSQSDPFLAYGIERSFRVRRLPCLDLMPQRHVPFESLLYFISRASFFRSLAKAFVLEGVDWGYSRDPATVAALLKIYPGSQICMEVHSDPRGNIARWQTIRSGTKAWVALTTGIKELLVSEGIAPDDICVASDGFSPEEFWKLPTKVEARRTLGLPEETLLFVYTGNQLLPRKGLDGLASAFRILPEKSMLAIVGGQASDHARIRAAAGGDIPQVRFIEQLPREKARLWMAAADAAILPTSGRTEIGRMYTSPVKLFEYLAAGLPVIASDLPTSREVLTEAESLFFTPDDPASFHKALMKFAALSQEGRLTLGHEARERSRGLTWEARGQRIAEFLRKRAQRYC